HRGLQQLRADIAPVAEKILRAAAAAPGAGRAGEAGDPDPALPARGDGGERGSEVPPEEGVHRALRAAVPRREKLLLAVLYAADGHVRPAERAAQRGLDAGGALGPVRLHELQPGRRVVKEPADDHRRPLGAA